MASSGGGATGSGSGKQLKLNELKRVVNVDIVKKYAAVLEDTSNTDSAEIERILDELGKKTPSREILVKTRLGFILKDLSLRKQLPKRVREKAAQLRLKWKEFHKRLLYAEKYDVKCDKPTTEHRERTRQALTNAFKSRKDCESGTSEFEDDQLVVSLEFGLFKYCDCLINAKYFSTTRRLVSAITSTASTSTTQAFLRRRIDAAEFIAASLVYSDESETKSEENENSSISTAAFSSSSTSTTSTSTSSSSSMSKSASCMSFSNNALSNNNQNISNNNNNNHKAPKATLKTATSGSSITVPISAFFKTTEVVARKPTSSTASKTSAKSSKYF